MICVSCNKHEQLQEVKDQQEIRNLAVDKRQMRKRSQVSDYLIVVTHLWTLYKSLETNKMLERNSVVLMNTSKN